MNEQSDAERLEALDKRGVKHLSAEGVGEGNIILPIESWDWLIALASRAVEAEAELADAEAELADANLSLEFWRGLD